jgi:hypothetical protein
LISIVGQIFNSIAMGKLLIITAVFFSIAPSIAHINAQTTCQVPSASYSTIQSALDDSNCDSIEVASGTFDGKISISRQVTINGSGEDTTFIDGNQRTQVVDLLGGAFEVYMSNLTIQNGRPNPLVGADRDDGGGIELNRGTELTLENVTVRNNISDGEGGIRCNGDSLVLNNVTIKDNIGGTAGGISSCLEMNFQDVIISGNSGNLVGGMTISSLGAESRSKRISLTNVLITRNSSATGGGGIFIGGSRFSAELQVTMNNVTITENAAPQGGGMRIDPKSILSIADVTIERNTAEQGAGIFVGTTPLLPTDSTIAMLRNISISSNVASDQGGAIFNASGRYLVLDKATLRGNSAFSGGAILNEGTLEIRDSLIAESVADNGGAIRNNSELVISSSTFQGNSAEVGGAIFNNGAVSLLNVTLAENTSGTLGGAIFNEEKGSVSLIFATIDSSSALAGGGLFNSGGTILIKNSLLANSLSGGNCALRITSEGHNLSSDGSCLGSLTLSSDFNNIDPLLDPSGLRNNGGSAATIALLAESIAIDAIAIEECTDMNGNLVTADQRGAFRPQGVGCDIGAFEVDS